MPKISVIMPVYNSKAYLLAAIESVLNQTFSDFELLLIDDGSTDGSGSVCDAYAETDPRIIVFHKQNGGIGSARNFGLLHARGEYVTFIDNDDVYKLDFLEEAIENIQKHNADFVKCGSERWLFHDGKLIKKELRTTGKDFILNRENFLEQYFDIKQTCVINTIWNGLYKRTFLINNHIQFNETIKTGIDDQIFMIALFRVFEKAVFIKEAYYIWFNRSNHSLSLKYTSNFIEENLITLQYEKEMIAQYDKSCLASSDWAFRESEYLFRGLNMIFRHISSVEVSLEQQKIDYKKLLYTFRKHGFVSFSKSISIWNKSKKRSIIMLLVTMRADSVSFFMVKKYLQLKKI